MLVSALKEAFPRYRANILIQRTSEHNLGVFLLTLRYDWRRFGIDLVDASTYFILIAFLSYQSSTRSESKSANLHMANYQIQSFMSLLSSLLSYTVSETDPSIIQKLYVGQIG